MQQLRDLFGKEHALDSVNRTLYQFARSQRAAAVGAVHVVTYSNECEPEATSIRFPPTSRGA